MTIQTPSGELRPVTPGEPWKAGKMHFTGSESPETLAGLGYVVQPEPEPDPPPTLEEVRAARVEALAAECDARLAERWPTADMLAALAGVPTTPPAGLAEDVAAHLAIRDSLLDAVTAATTIDEVKAVTWPE
jgi:hypothetical protein